MVFSKICVVGLGYIGLPTAAMFASRDVNVTGVDVSRNVVETINRGEIHIVEPGLEDLVKFSVQTSMLRATGKPERADAFIIAVPTPFKDDNHSPDLTYVEAAAFAIAPMLDVGNIVILESTSPVGTTKLLAEWLSSARPDLTFPQTHGSSSDVRIAYCPERVLPGNVIEELINNDRLIGGMTSFCSQIASELYKIFVLGECVETDAEAAELSKLAENSFRDVNIAFANELSLICDRIGVNVWDVIALANRHPRVNILQPGAGVGGHCIAVDPWFIVSSAPKDSRIIRLAREVNDSKPNWVTEKVLEAITAISLSGTRQDAKDVTVACYGLSFKPDIDDMRESPAIKIVQNILELYPGPVLVVEPHISELPDGLERAELVNSVEANVRADLHVYLVAHTEFKLSAKPASQIIDVVGLFL